MLKNVALILAIVALVLAPTAGISGPGCDKSAAKTAVVKSDCSKDCSKGCCDDPAKAAMLAKNAGAGCEKSASELVAMAKKSGCEETAALAAKAEAGDEEAMTVLVAKYEAYAAKSKSGESQNGPTDAQLAAWAGSGCDKSADQLVARAQGSSCPKTAELAAKAAGGCEKSKQELIAMMAEDEGTETN
jgi:hypothetical protein